MRSIPAGVTAVDTHTHPQTEEFLAAMGARRRQMGEHFGKERTAVSFAEMADRYRALDMMAVIVNSDDETQSGVPGAPNRLLGEAMAAHPDVFLAFCGVDPWKGELALEEVRRCHGEYGVLGLGELNPSRQKFYPNDPRFYPLWELCSELGLVVMFHCGFPGAGAGSPGGMGYQLDHARPVPYLDQVAADFPELRVIAAHPGWPWHLENLAACWHKNYYIDLSGWSPKYLPDEVVRYADSLITSRVLFGSDWPVLDPERWLKEFAQLPFKAGSRERILLRNACELFELEQRHEWLVAVVGVQHNPLLWRTLAEPADHDLQALKAAFAETSQRLLATEPDVLVIFATDHLTQWFYENMPTFLIGKAPVVPATFANETREFGIPEKVLAGDVELASWLLHDGLTRGVDYASSDDYRADHSVLVPLHFLTPALDLPIVPVFTNCIAPPLPSAERLYAVGEAVRASVDACPLARRVAVIASGHLATEVGGAKHFRGSPDLEFDAESVEMVRDGRLAEVQKLATFERLREAGNVSHQFLNFVAAMGVVGGHRASYAKAMYSRFATSPFFEWYGGDLG